MDNIQKQNENAKQALNKEEQIEIFRMDHDATGLTTNQGLKLSNTDDSLKAGDRGPTLMEDFHFREKVMHFDHERIPERVVHARGSGAHGYFQVYEPMGKYTKAKFLQDPSVKTPVFVRFSTVVGSRGSADTVRDVRGFATKFYTEEGNYDLVANNIPIFFIHDGIKFPDIVHAIKPEPDNEIPQATAAHDTFWDFTISTPELAHMIMWLMSDRAIPKSFRMMEGFGVNTFRFINAQNKPYFVRFHWKPVLGVHALVWDEAQKISGNDPDFHRRDLWDAIDMGEYPEFELGIQVLDEEDEFRFDFDILDATKFWPEELVPVELIGKMVLNKNPDNFFAETEQVAFHPGHVVPGIDFTNDPLLQGRLFSYLDTQLIRLGGPNFHEIPINRPLAPVHNNQRDGYNRMTIDQGKVSYSPNSLRGNEPHVVPEGEGGYTHYAEKVEGKKIRERSPSFKDFYGQAALFWNSMSSIEKQHIVEAFHFEVGKVKDKGIRQKVVDMFNNVDGDLATQIAQGIGVNPPANPTKLQGAGSSPAISMENTVKDNPRTRKIAILAENGFNYSDLTTVMKNLKNVGVTSEVISMEQGVITGDNGQALEAGQSYLTTASVLYDGVYIPGGQESIDTMMTQGDTIAFINEAFKHAKTIGSTNEGVDLLIATSIQGVEMAGPNITNQLFTGLGVVTIRGPQDMNIFTQEFTKSLAQHRHWGRQSIKGKIPS